MPTTKEAGFDNCEVKRWFGILVPAGTPRAIVNRLNAEWVKIATSPDVKDQLVKAEYVPISSTPEEFSEFLKSEVVRWVKIIKDADVKSVD